MGWIAAGASTLVAACLIYTLLTRHADHDSRPEIVQTTQHEQRDKEQLDGLVDGGDEGVSLASKGRPTSNGAVPAPPTITAPDQPTPPLIATSTAPTTLRIPLSPQPAIPTSRTPSPNNMAPPPRPNPSPPPLRDSSPPRLKPPSMAPPPRPSAASSLRVPVTKVLSNSHMQPASSTLPLPTATSARSDKSRQITLAPGFSPLDWAALSRSPSSTPQLLGSDFLRLSPGGVPLKIPPSLLRHHNGRKGKDAWTSYQGRVYNLTPYLPFHPGGKNELMRAAGREGEALFMEVHPWVNWEGMLGDCCLGVLVPERDGWWAVDGGAVVDRRAAKLRDGDAGVTNGVDGVLMRGNDEDGITNSLDEMD